VPARAQHAASLRAITARQLQALVRPQLEEVLFLRARDLHGGDAPTLGVLNPDVENPGSASVADLAQCPAYEDVAVVPNLLVLRRRRLMACWVLNCARRSALVNSVPSASTTVKSSAVRRSQVAASAFATASSRARMASRRSAGTCAAIALGRGMTT